MKTVVFITGTNCVGKSTLARNLIRHYGGIAEETATFTLCADRRVCFAGTGYGGGAECACGVDKLGSTRTLADVVKQGLERSNCVICEGSFLNSFGLNLTNAMFAGNNALVVFLYAPISELNNRRLQRSNRQANGHMVTRQNGAARAAKKWQSIGVHVLAIDTSHKTPNEIADMVINKLHKYGL